MFNFLKKKEQKQQEKVVIREVTNTVADEYDEIINTANGAACYGHTDIKKLNKK